MDCKAARLLLAFPATGPDALDRPEADVLRDHLDVCAECDAASRAEARHDAQIGRAVRDVPVPAGLKDRVLARLAAERAEMWRKRVLTAVRAAVGAAAVFAAVALGMWLLRPRPSIDPGEMHLAWNVARPTNAETIDTAFASLGYRGCAPDFVNYGFPCVVGEGDVPGHPGRKAPRMVFIGPHEHAVIIALPWTQVPDDVGNVAEPGYKYRAEVRHPAGSRWAYVVLYTGENWDWLYSAPE